MATSLRIALPFALALSAACGESTPPPKAPPPTKNTVREPAAASAQPVTSLRRARVKEAITQGVGAFLQNVTVEDWPVMHEGKFHGFKIKTINTEWGVDLKPGDVVTRVNGIVPEHPDDADAALRALEKAAALKVEFERDGKTRTLELPIVD
jgi:type II secretory pathway component PulC